MRFQDGQDKKPRSPSDLLPGERASSLCLAGRVLATEGAALTLADAFARVEVKLAEPAALSPGELVVLEGRLEAGALEDARLLQRTAPMRPPHLPERAAYDDDLRPGSETERLITRGIGPSLRARAEALSAIRALFREEGFLEVDTPALVPSPGLDLHLDAFEVAGASGPGFSNKTGYLITSPEYQMKRLLVGGVPRCYQFARCYRRGEIGQRHNPEFLMLEWYRAFADLDEIIEDTIAIVRGVARALGSGERIAVGEYEVRLDQGYERLEVGRAFERYAGVGADEAIAMASSDEERFFRILVEKVEPALERESKPVVLCDYPAPFASLARLRPDDPRVAERFELYVAGVELCNGFGELSCAREQRERLLHDQREREERGLPVYPIDEAFLAALEEGMPPSAGNALGVDRLIALCLGTFRIGDVQAFPVDWL